MDMMHNDLRRSLGLPAVPLKGMGGGKLSRSHFDSYSKAVKDVLAETTRIQTIQRFKWHGLPKGIDGELLEQIIYTNGSVAVFYDKITDKFMSLPYALTSENVRGSAIDTVRRYREIKPIPYGGASALFDDKGKAKAGAKPSVHDVYLGEMCKTNVLEVPYISDLQEAIDIYNNGAVIIFDRTPGRAYQVTGRESLIQPFLEELETILSTLQAALVNSTGFGLFAVADGNSAELIQAQLDAITEARLHGAVNAAIDAKGINLPENLQTNHPVDLDMFWANFYNMHNLMRMTLGVDSSGQTNGSQYTNQAQIAVNNAGAQAVYINAFHERVKAAVIINAIWGTKCYPEPVQLTGIELYDTMEAEESEDKEPAVTAGEGEGFNDETSDK